MVIGYMVGRKILRPTGRSRDVPEEIVKAARAVHTEIRRRRQVKAHGRPGR
jgi:hypothetical protein